MSILAWIVLGLIAGFIGSKIVNKSGEGLIMDIVLGNHRRGRAAAGCSTRSAMPASPVSISTACSSPLSAPLWCSLIYHAVRRA